MSKEASPLVSLLKDIMRRRKRLPSQLASDLGVSHATVSRWLSGKDTPSMQSCRKLAAYSGIPLYNVLVAIGYLSSVTGEAPSQWPEFREYARQKYPDELDDDLVVMIEDLIERRRARKRGK